MKHRNSFFVLLLVFTLQFTAHPLPSVADTISRASTASFNDSVAPQQEAGALERGYRTGYSDGYQAGWRDSLDRAARDARNKQEYLQADRAYVATYGSLEDYRGGYRQGFEVGYGVGYDRRTFDSTVPGDLTRSSGSGGDNRRAGPASDDGAADPSTDATVMTGGSTVVPADTTMRVELLHSLSTDASMRGDRFEARVLEPRQYEGATIEGRVGSVRRPGKLRGTAELQLSFDQIRFTDNRAVPFNAQVTEIVRHDEVTAGDVDREGGVRGKDSTRDDATKIGSGAAIGAVIGAITGGGKGAAIGAVIGGGVATGGAIATRGKEVRLERGQQIMLRTAGDTRGQ